MKTTKRVIPVLLAVLLMLPVMSFALQPARAGAAENIGQSEYSAQVLREMLRERRTEFLIPNYNFLNLAPADYFDQPIGESYVASSISPIMRGGIVAGYRISYAEEFEFPDGSTRSAEETVRIVEDFYDRMLADIPEDLDDVSKLVLINNRLCQQTGYSINGKYPFSVLGPALESNAVCEGYAKAFKYLCDKLGIECRYEVVSLARTDDHAANIVTLNGRDYIVDTTNNWGKSDWLLCSADKYNAFCSRSHKEFLGADAQLTTAVYEDYDHAWWTACDPRETAFRNGDFYNLKSQGFTNRGKLRLGLFKNNTEKIAEFTCDDWFEDGRVLHYAMRFCSGEAVCYITPDAIWKYNLRTGERSEFFRPANTGGKQLTEFYLNGNTLYYLLTDAATEADADAYEEYADDIRNYGRVEIVDRDLHYPVPYGDEGDCAHSATSGVKCGVCGAILTPAAETGVTGPHKGEWTDCTATCTEAGTETRVCEICGVTETRDAPAKGHYYSPFIPENVPTPDNHNIPATCAQEGRTMTLTCSICGEVKQGETIPKTLHKNEFFYNENSIVFDHDYTSDINFGYVTCTTGGTVPGLRCTICGEVTREPVDHPEGLGHIPVETEPRVAPTCTSIGHEARCVCGRCHKSLPSSYIPNLGHDYVELDPPVDHPATCTEDRYVVKTACSRCGDTGSTVTYRGTAGHVDENGDALCDDCGAAITAETKMRGRSPSGNGSSGGNSSSGQSGGFFDKILDFFRRIINFFKNLFSR